MAGIRSQSNQQSPLDMLQQLLPDEQETTLQSEAVPPPEPPPPTTNQPTPEDQAAIAQKQAEIAQVGQPTEAPQDEQSAADQPQETSAPADGHQIRQLDRTRVDADTTST